MADPRQSSPEHDPIEQAAASWVLRIDAGLSPAGETELADWLSADPRHAAALAEFQSGWNRFAPLAATAAAINENPDPDVLAPSRQRIGTGAGVEVGRTSPRKILHFVPATLAAAAALALGFHFLRAPEAPSVPVAPVRVRTVLVPLCELRTLEDGSVVELNRGAAIAVNFTVGERHVELLRGEAHFKVAHDAARPFFVRAGGVETRAVGTAFNVRFDSAAVEVVVTEGTVAVARDPVVAHSPAPAAAAPVTLLKAGERALVSLASSAPAPVVATLSPVELETRLAWKPKLLDFDDVPLADMVAEFNRHNPVHIRVADQTIGALRLTATFRSDNMDGFVRLLEANYGIAVELDGPTAIVLRRP
jgi:transmembrane sensor